MIRWLCLFLFPFVWLRETPVTGNEVIGYHGDQTLSRRVNDSTAHDPSGVASKAHAHDSRNLCRSGSFASVRGQAVMDADGLAFMGRMPLFLSDALANFNSFYESGQ